MSVALDALAAHRLPGARQPAIAEGQFSDAEWARLEFVAATHGLDGLLADAVARGAVEVTDAQRAASTRRQVEAMSGCLVLETALLDAFEILTARSIAVLAVNGVPAAHLDYPDPSLRPFRDCDLVVPAGAVTEATTALASAGFRQSGPRTTTRLVDERGRRLELHPDSAFAGPRAALAPGELWSTSNTMVLAGRPIGVLGDHIRCVVACLRARSVGDHRLIAVRDVVQQVLAGRLAPEAVVETAERWRVAAVVADTIDLAWHRFVLADVVSLSVWAARTRRSGDAGTASGKRPERGTRRRLLARRSRAVGP